MTISSAAMDLTLEMELEDRNTDARWFSCGGCVVAEGSRSSVYIRGTLIGCFSERDVGSRNAILMGLSADPKMHLGELAAAFDISSDGLRRMRRIYERDGLGPLLARRAGGGHEKVTPAIRRRLEKLFDDGSSVTQARAAVRKKIGLSRGTVGRVRLAWWARKQSVERGHAEPKLAPSVQLSLVPASEAEVEVFSVVDGDGGASSATTDVQLSLACLPAAVEPSERVESGSPQSANGVQHLGTWLLVALVHRLGLHAQAAEAVGERAKRPALRVALDAVVAALALGEGCVEGVRRLATASAAALMLASRAPSPTWTRRVLGRFAQNGGALALHLGMARVYLDAARQQASGAGPVFFIDNHLRPYTGQEVLRRGWRMQDKRVRPGTTDYYLHDEDGRPLGRLPVPAHDSLTTWLSPLARLLRLGLGKEESILLAFDRAGAFPEQMAGLRNEDFEFVTYERRPYPCLPDSAFIEALSLDGEKLRWCESRTNLGAGRGRVRRISLKMPDGYKLNLLAASVRPATELIEIMSHRWRQENAFKHGVERWGINQLDGRTVAPYPPDTIIPNPARRRIDRALRINKAREGLARTELAHLPKGDARRTALHQELDSAMAERKKLEKLRPSMPTHVALKDTELADKLVLHPIEYKMVLDTIRIACANAEADLAGELAPLLPRAAEAKKTLANLLAAPGSVRVGRRTIGITLEPAGTRREQKAFAGLLRIVNEWGLSHPGDHQHRRLRFSTPRIS